MTQRPSQAFLDGMAAVERCDRVLSEVRRKMYAHILAESVEAIRLGSLERRAAAGDKGAKEELVGMADGLDAMVRRLREGAA